MDWKRERQLCSMARHGAEQAAPRRGRISGPHSHLPRAPVRRWADMGPEERRRIEVSLGLRAGGGKHWPSPVGPGDLRAP